MTIENIQKMLIQGNCLHERNIICKDCRIDILDYIEAKEDAAKS